jgi:succinate dehydrogenase hydrophobic anchor subunit
MKGTLSWIMREVIGVAIVLAVIWLLRKVPMVGPVVDTALTK